MKDARAVVYSCPCGHTERAYRLPKEKNMPKELKCNLCGKEVKGETVKE